MKQHQLLFSYDEYPDVTALTESDAALLEAARSATKLAHAPYSRFLVGAAARLSNGIVLKGSNQENASSPAGLCAERVLMSVCSTLYPGMPVIDMAISYYNELGKSDSPITPCGICRQSLLEYETIVHHPIRLILGGYEGKVYVIGKANDLLPIAFTSSDMH